MKRSLLALLDLDSSDELSVLLPYEKLKRIISIWLLSDNELYFLQHYAKSDQRRREDFLNDLDEVVTTHNIRKTISWIRNEAKLLYRLHSYLNKDHTKGKIVVGQYIYDPEYVRADASGDVTIEDCRKVLQSVENDFSAFSQNRDSQAPSFIHEDADMIKDAEAIGAQLHSLVPADVQGFGRALVAKENLDPGAILMTLKEGSLVNIYQALAEGFRETESDSVSCSRLEQDKRYSIAFVWALLLGGRYPDGSSLLKSAALTEEMKEFYNVYVPPDFLIQEQLFLIFFIAYETSKGDKSKWYPWLKNLKGYEDCVVSDGYENVLITKCRQELLNFVRECPLDDETSPLRQIETSVNTVEDCVLKLREWLLTYIVPMFPEFFEDCLDQSLSKDRLLWSCWVCESREFESPIPIPTVFFNRFNDVECGLKIRSTDPQIRAQFQETQDDTDIQVTVTTSSSDAESKMLKLLPELSYLSEQAFGGAHGVRHTIILPVQLGWKKVGESFVRWTELLQFDFTLKVLTLVPIVDFLNHHEKAQCPHPGFHDQESRLIIHRSHDSLAGKLDVDLAVNDGLSLLSHWHELCDIVDLEDRRFVLCTQTRVSKGEQVFINYGPHESWSFLRYYGFVSSEAEVITIIISPDLCYEPESASHKTRTCMMKVFNVPEEHILSEHGTLDMMLAAARILAFPNLESFISSNTEESVRQMIYNCEDNELNKKALMLLANILQDHEAYKYDCYKYGQLCDLAVEKNPPRWFVIWGQHLFKLIGDRKAIIEKALNEIICQIELLDDDN